MSGFKTLYCIGLRKPIPRPNPHHGWSRPQHEEPITEPVVFLTPSWKKVWCNHGRHGNVYIFKVPKKIVRKCGIRKYDYAPEIIIPEELWEECELIGKIDYKEAEKQVKRDKNYSSINTSPPGSCVEDSPNAQELEWMRLVRAWELKSRRKK